MKDRIGALFSEGCKCDFNDLLLDNESKLFACTVKSKVVAFSPTLPRHSDSSSMVLYVLEGILLMFTERYIRSIKPKFHGSSF